MNRFIAITYWTDSRYKALARRTLKSAKFFGIKSKGYAVKSRGRWKENTEIKPKIIVQTMDENPGWDVLWLDADSYFFSYPKLLFEFPQEYDAAFYVEPRTFWGCTMYFRNNEWSRRMLREWDAQCKRTPRFSADSNFRYLLMKHGMLNVYQLPPAYVWYEQLLRKRFPGAKPVIVQDMVVTCGNKKLRRSQVRTRKEADWAV